MSSRFFEQQSITINHKVILSEENSHKIISVLKLPIGSIITIFNNTNTEFTAKITELKIFKNKKNNKLIEIEILKATTNNLESPLKIHLVQAIAKNDNMDLIIQKAVELGVHQVTPIITERTIVKIATNQITKKIDHWQSIAINACCQCGRNIIPKVNPALVFNDFIKNNFFNKFILSPTIKFLKDGQKLQMDLAKEIILLIGPEGGFSNKEMELAVQNQYLPINIGPRVLRTETASLVALSIFQYQYGDLNKNDNYSLR